MNTKRKIEDGETEATKKAKPTYNDEEEEEDEVEEDDETMKVVLLVNKFSKKII